MTVSSSEIRPAQYRKTRSWLEVIAIIIAALIALPMLAILFSLFSASEGTLSHLLETQLPRYLKNTALLCLLVGIGVSVIGVGSAWLVTMCVFPMRRALEWLLALPLAFPAYVMAYAYTDLLDFGGPVQSALRAAFDWGPRDYWFPEIRSLGGAAAMLTLVLYPYVYLLARAAFLQQSVAAFEVARTLGYGPFAAFRRVAVPMARPAIVTGVALAMMETLADFGTVSHFGVPTFATGIFRSWILIGDRIVAAQLSAMLLIAVLVVLALEKTARGAARYHQTGKRYQSLPEYRLSGGRAFAAMLFCLLPAILGFFLPLIILGHMSLIGGHAFFGSRYIGFALNSLTLAGLAAIITVVLALMMAYAARLGKSRLTRSANAIAGLGYAVPGAVIAVGLLMPLGWLDGIIAEYSGAGLLLTGSIFALLYAYAVRFMSVALQTVEASLGKVTPSMDHAARALGRSASGALWAVHVPMIRGGLMTASLIVFVDVMKELPATLILRPFNFDTLAVQAYRLASDERLLQASTPSIAIVLVGLLPVILLTWEIRRSRPGS